MPSFIGALRLSNLVLRPTERSFEVVSNAAHGGREGSKRRGAQQFQAFEAQLRGRPQLLTPIAMLPNWGTLLNSAMRRPTAN
jgi:hypothetical protein